MKITFTKSQRTIFKIIGFCAILLIVCIDIFDEFTESHKLLSLNATRIITAKEEAKVVKKKAKLIKFDEQTGRNVSDIYNPGFSTLPSLICKGDDKNPKVLIIISSAPGNFEARKAIRYAWFDIGVYDQVQFVFIMGSSKTAQESKIVDEILKHDDIIRGKFIDNDENLSIKTISMLEWISSNCKNAKFILKIDDQTFVNIEKLQQIIDGKLLDTKSIYGKISESSVQVRSKKSKKFLSYGKSQLEFISGPVYMMTSDCVQLIYEAALDSKYFNLEDVFITGVISNLLGIKIINVEEFKDSFPNSISRCDLRNIISIHGVSADQHYDLWFTLNDESVGCD